MSRSFPRPALACLALGLLALAPAAARAQNARPAWTRNFVQHPITLATLDDVAGELKLTPEQKTKVADLETSLREGRQQVFQNANGDFDQMRKEMTKFYSEKTDEINKSLDEAQQKRLGQIFLQVNGLLALQDEKVTKLLGLSEEQQTKLSAAIDEARGKLFSSFQEMQGMSEDERNKKTEEMAKERDESYATVLTEEQKKKLDELKGPAFDADLSKLPNPFGG